MAEKIIVRLWVTREEMNPEPRSDTKYPREITRNRDPASAWLISRSDSIPGINGANTIRARKLTKKMDVSSSSGIIPAPKLV